MDGRYVYDLLGFRRRIYERAISDVVDALNGASASFKEDQDIKNILILCGRELKATNRIDGERLRQNFKSFKGMDVENKPANEIK
jgi:hypothetical protein